jgi:hypothetical protein
MTSTDNNVFLSNLNQIKNMVDGISEKQIKTNEMRLNVLGIKGARNSSANDKTLFSEYSKDIWKYVSTNPYFASCSLIVFLFLFYLLFEQPSYVKKMVKQENSFFTQEKLCVYKTFQYVILLMVIMIVSYFLFPFIYEIIRSRIGI